MDGRPIDKFTRAAVEMWWQGLQTLTMWRQGLQTPAIPVR
jgi:hypothetical protein